LAFARGGSKLGRSREPALTIRAPQQHRPENAATLAGIALFVVTAAFAPALVRPALDELFLGYTPHYLGVLVGLAAGFVAARATYRRVRAAA
jgi:uncharacterized membrane protein required for colicin V production